MRAKPAKIPVRLSAAEVLLGEAPAELVRWLGDGDPSRPPEGGGLEWAGNSPASLARRLEFQFPFTDAQAFEKASREIRGLARDEWEAWTAAALLDSLVLFGERRFARSFLTNLLARDIDIRLRAPGFHVKNPPAELHLEEHFAEIIHRARHNQAMPSWRHRARHRVDVKPGAVPLGETIRCWLPFPKAAGQQRNMRLVASSPGTAALAPENAPQRSAYLEGPQTAAGASFEIEYEFETSPSRYRYTPKKFREASDETDPGLFVDELGHRPPRENLSAEMRALAEGIAGRERQPLLKAHRIYRWIVENVRYVAEFEYGLLPSLSRKGADTGEGDCGIMAMLFIVLCRCQGVPARWQSGWFFKPEGGNMHDWAEFYAEPFGWLPADPTYGFGDSGDPTRRWFYCGGVDGFRMVANTDWGEGLYPAKEHERSEPVDFQRGELEWRGGNLFFDQWTYEVSWTSERLDSPA